MKFFLVIAGVATAFVAYRYFQRGAEGIEAGAGKSASLGEVVLIHRGVPVYSNGDHVYQSHGRHYAADGYYYGHKWQCVEFVKRYYHDALQHNMPNVWGHAYSFFDSKLAHGELNTARNMIQFHNSHSESPKVDDLLVWGGKYGHVAVISEVSTDHIVVVQQNIKSKPSAQLELVHKGGVFTIGSETKPIGWLRMND